MKRFSKFLLVLFMVVLIGGCGKNECKCPSDTDGNVAVDNSSEMTDYGDLYLSVVRSVVFVRVQNKSNYSVVATGSGVVAYEEGDYAYIYTNAHVIKDLTSDYEIEVFFADEEGDQGGEHEIARLMGKDYNEDVAILEITKSSKYQVAKIGDINKISVGNPILAVGSPLGFFNIPSFGGYITNVNNATVMDNTTGVTTTAYNSILFNAELNPGNSGGALFNKDGELIGITTLKYKDTTGMNVAISIDFFSKVAKYVLVNNRDYVRPALNINIKSINEMGTQRELYNIHESVKNGVYVESSLEVLIPVQAVITEINGVKIKSLTEYNVELLKYNIGDTVTLTLINRDGLNTRNVSVVLHAW